MMRAMGQLDDAVRAYRRAQQAVETAQRAAAARIKAAREAVDVERERLAAAIVAEARAGTPQVEIVHRTGYSRERVRTILRAGGVTADS